MGIIRKNDNDEVSAYYSACIEMDRRYHKSMDV